MMGTLLGNLLSAALAPPPVNTPPSQQPNYKQKIAAQEKKKKHREALARWKKIKEDAAATRAQEKAKRQEEGKQLLAKMGPVGSGKPLQFQPLNKGREVEIEKAKKRIATLRDEVNEIQIDLWSYRDGLLSNASGLDKERRNVSKMSDKILVDGVEYLKGGAFSGLLKMNFRYLNKAKYEKYENIIEHVEQLQTEKDIFVWMNSRSGEMEKLIEGTDMLASSVIPGWDHIKMNFKAWSTVAKECSSWRKINKLNRETSEYARAVEDLATRMKSKVAEINCLKQCMDSSQVGCVERCSEVSRPN